MAGNIVNGVAYSHNSFFIEAQSDYGKYRLKRFKEFNYKHGIESSTESNGIQPVASTVGEYDGGEADLTVSRKIHKEMMDALIPRIRGTFSVPIHFVITLMARGQPTITDEVATFKIKNEDPSDKGGTDPTEVKLEFQCAYMLIDGRMPIDNMQR